MKKSINNDIKSRNDFRERNRRAERWETIKSVAIRMALALGLLVGFYCLVLLAYAIN